MMQVIGLEKKACRFEWANKAAAWEAECVLDMALEFNWVDLDTGRPIESKEAPPDEKAIWSQMAAGAKAENQAAAPGPDEKDIWAQMAAGAKAESQGAAPAGPDEKAIWAQMVAGAEAENQG